ncbi:universal stress family protein [Collimonas fungivorans]|jgi:nucleotide-binding universal stress UspA family protein|uniref:Universal stress family protein n=1 Tax=Collimonas fungivorans TaxID=158899 RepID=A0A127PGH7_9BURK|nr:universal stress protein [Collimonas fungivorans]AMO96825.1 universal stress family protein [Collimonas fungivorans]
MYRKILVAYNGTPESRSALYSCIQLAPGPDVEVHLLGVINLATYLMAGEFVAESAIRAEKTLLEQELIKGHKLLSDAGIKAVDHFESGEPVNVISDLVSKLAIDLVIVGHSRKKPMATRWWRGSVDTLLVEKVPCSVLVATDPCPPT